MLTDVLFYSQKIGYPITPVEMLSRGFFGLDNGLALGCARGFAVFCNHPCCHVGRPARSTWPAACCPRQPIVEMLLLPRRRANRGPFSAKSTLESLGNSL